MRWIFYALLLANAGYIAWAMQQADPPRAPVTTVDRPIPGHVNRLLLVSEMESGELRERAPPAPDPAPAAPQPADTVRPSPPVDPMELFAELQREPSVCYMVGPLEDAQAVARVEEWLRAEGGDAVLRVGERREISLYWVYFPPFPTLEQATERRREMQQRGIEDIFLIPRGDQANAISLGVYSQRSSLERRLRELRAKGYEPSMVPRYKTTKASWFDVAFPPGYEFPDERFAAAFPDAAASPMGCGSIASAEDDSLESGSEGPDS